MRPGPLPVTSGSSKPFAEAKRGNRVLSEDEIMAVVNRK